MDIVDIVAQGKKISDDRASKVIDRNIGELKCYNWSLLHQYASSLCCKQIWEIGVGHDIEKSLSSVGNKLIDESSSIIRIFDSDECLPIIHDGYNEHGYFSGFSSEISDIRKSEFKNGLSILNSWLDWKWILDLIGSIIILPEANGSHLSYSQRDLPGTIFSQPVPNGIYAGEVLIHESLHTAFNLVLVGLEIEEVVLNSKKVVYSPWKKEYRPLFGFLHAVFAFGGIELYRNWVGLDPHRKEDFESSLPSLKQVLQEIDCTPLSRLFASHVNCVTSIIS